MEVEKLMKQLRKTADMESTGFMARCVILSAERALLKQKKEMEKMERVVPVRCGECQRRQICRLWELGAGDGRPMEYHDYCSKGTKKITY